MDKEAKYKNAKKRVEDLKGFYVHIAIYLVINAGLFVLDWVTGEDWWFYWVLLGWGIAVFIHAVTVLGIARLFGSEWEEKKIKEIMDKE